MVKEVEIEWIREIMFESHEIYMTLICESCSGHYMNPEIFGPSSCIRVLCKFEELLLREP